MPTPPEILKRETACQSRLFKAEALQLRFSNGEVRDYERLMGSHAAVLIVPVLPDNRVVMVREYGAGVERYELTLPKGKVDAGETFEEAANRELQEEAGYAATRLTKLKLMSQSPSYMQHTTQIVLAQGLTPSRLAGDEPEPLEVEIHSLDSLAELIARADVTEARTIAALYMVRELLRSV
ncbi:ADP compounds hydrolase NudE [Marinagarivorans cellulosilyticus]|uniref:ADP-ribose diphosphatase n=1 Tax=Marinagarivorans cellulosilyticus TaxID=2721545 RepID=A0AAN2BLK5_9GAMM|nr:ADP compounds hydrolase NudE [Marinagarivorans cellulosilyticus]BCD99152.1 ADP-ribose diphosphatase [Marinagarivorans cellulosilyticus]